MYIEWTERAAEKIAGKLADTDGRGYMQLKYDTDGCGCVVSGVTALWLLNEPEAGSERVETNGIPLYVETSKMIFLDEKMKIDFVPECSEKKGDTRLNWFPFFHSLTNRRRNRSILSSYSFGFSLYDWAWAPFGAR